MMSIFFNSVNVSIPDINLKNISLWINQTTMIYGYKISELTYVFCDDEYLKEINIEFLSHDYYTDIITFEYSENRNLSGDLFISIDRVKENSINMEVSFSIQG